MLYTAYENFKEKEQRATTISLLGTTFHVALFYLILNITELSFLIYGYYAVIALTILVLLVPRKPNERALQGIQGYLTGEPLRPDERDAVSRRRRLEPRTEVYHEYYSRHPEWEESDQKSRESERITGVIDGRYQPNMAMTDASFMIPHHMASIAYAEPMREPYQMSPEKTTMIIKNLAKHLGAKLVGVEPADLLLMYTNSRTSWKGRWVVEGEKRDYPPYAVVMATEMNYDHMISAPHTPVVAETGNQYANGSYISSVIAHWFSNMGYTGIAEHTGHYDAVMPPLAVQAGLGEIGRNGFLITPTLGSRVRLSAVLTDMPLVMDKPIDIAVEEFCMNCEKCADTCPSKSIPRARVQINGIKLWLIVWTAQTVIDP
jgi:ferredoxin